MRIAGITKNSYVNGPGRRNVLHVQGCTIGCPGCFNAHTWDPEKGAVRRWLDVYDELVSGNPEGITISGGEPTEQWSPVGLILHRVRDLHPKMTVLMFTGLTHDELKKKAFWEEEGPKLFDLIVSGPYIKEQHCKEPLRGSSNQELIFITNRISKESLSDIPSIEIHLDGDQVTIAGFPGKDVRKDLLRTFKE